jgi:phage terminase large subunit-like protein
MDGQTAAGRLVRLACERHLRDLVDGGKRGLVWRPDCAQHAIEFFRYLHHSKGEWAGRPFVLSPWQAFCVGSVFGWLRKKDGLRRFRVVYEEIPRKNGKSSKLAGVGVYGLVADREPGAEVFACATKKDQARIIFSEAQRMVRASPELRSIINVYKLNLSVDNTSSKFEPLSSDERTLDGLNPSMVLVDELHKHRNRALFDVMDTALGARRQPLMWIITTAGDDDPETVYASENDYAIKVLEGVVEDDTYFSYIATIDPGDRWDDPAAWAKANPALGVSVKLDDLQRQAAKAAASPPAQAAFKRLRLNVRQSTTDKGIDMDVWAANSRGPFDPAQLHGRRFFGGLDLASKVDLTAWVKLFPPTQEDDRWTVVCDFWIPGDTIVQKSDRDRVQYARWVDAGLVHATEGNIIDYGEVTAQVLEDCRLHEPSTIAYDPWNAPQLAQQLTAEGAPMIEFVQGVRSYNAATKELEAMLLAHKIDHGSNPVLTWMAHNLRITTPDRNNNVMPSKKHSTGRIDGMSGLIMAIGRSMIDDDGAGLDAFLNRPITA